MASSSVAVEGEMTVERIKRADDPRVAGYHGLRDGELARSRGLFVAEGRQVVRRVVEDGRYRVQSVLVNDAALRDLDETLARLGADVPIVVCGRDELAGIAGYDVHRGCLALVQRPALLTADELIAASPMLVVLEAVSNPDNEIGRAHV